MLPKFKIENALPYQSTSFIGRENDVLSLKAFLGNPQTRLLTLTGPGGVGKTRLAIYVCSALNDLFPDGIFFIDLAPISDPAQVPVRIARVLGIKESPYQPLIYDLISQLSDRVCLLILDNFEQIIDAGSSVSQLINGTTNLKILVTSREDLRLYGEQLFPVLPLNIPEGSREYTLDSLTDNESIRLFAQRAKAAIPDFKLTSENATHVASICCYLDGLPLAIELAAARISIFSPQFLKSKLENVLLTLNGGPRDIAERHKTIRAAIDWSYELLEEDEKRFFSQLGIFKGGRSIEAVAAICAQNEFDAAITGLESLLNKSLIQKGDGLDGEPRFVMLETIHQYAFEKLSLSGEMNNMRVKHAEYFVEFAENAVPELSRRQHAHWSAQIKQEYDNIQMALSWSLSGAATELGSRLAAAMADFWYYEGPVSDGRRWFNQALDYLDSCTPQIQSEVLNNASKLAFAYGDYRQGTAWNYEALAIARENQDARNSAWSLFWISAHTTTNAEQYGDGLNYCDEGIELFYSVDDKLGLVWSYNQIGELSRLVGDYSRAKDAYEEALQLCRQTGNIRRESIALINLGSVAQHQGDYLLSQQYIREGINLLYELELKYHSAIALSLLCGPAAGLGKARRAAILLGAAEAIFNSISLKLQPADRGEIDRYTALVRQQLDDESFNEAVSIGKRMSYEQAVEFAIENHHFAYREHINRDSHTKKLPDGTILEQLSERELQVLYLLQTSLNIKEISAELNIAESTTRTHIKRIYQKLDAHSRMQAVQRAKTAGWI